MIKDKTQNQESGDNSANYQAETINQYGISYRDAKEIALDVFNANFTKLSEEASNIARARADELINAFLKEIAEKNPALINSIKEPSMQSALYSAQKSYAISGDKNVADLLVDILVERAEQNERNLLQIVLDESLGIIPKLTIQQLDALSIIFLINNAVKKIENYEDLKNYFEMQIKPFTENLTKETSSYLHLQCSSCVIGEGAGRNLVVGFNRIADNFISSNSAQYLKTARKISVEHILLGLGEFMEELFDVWNNSQMKSMELTPVGFAIALANIKRRTGISYDLSKWVK